MFRGVLSSFLLFAAFGSAHAACYGPSSYRSCTDSNGNSYTARKLGNTSYTSGSDADGNTWRSSSRRSGNTTYTNGYESQGNSFSGQIRTNGRSTTYSGTDSKGRYYQKTCTATGCYSLPHRPRLAGLPSYPSDQ